MAAPLVPGDPAALRSFAVDLTDYGNGLAAAGDELKKVNAGEGWAGEAAQAFRAKYGGFTPQWFTAGDAFHGAAGAVNRYADVLEWAQGRAADAERLQAQAHSMSQAAVTEFNANVARGVSQPPFVDPGAATKEEIKKDGKWDLGHKPGHEFRKHQDDARQRDISRKEFLDEHNNPDNYRPETPNTNRSHKLEDKSDKPGGN